MRFAFRSRYAPRAKRGSEGTITTNTNPGFARVSGRVRTRHETSMMSANTRTNIPRTRAVKRSVITALAPVSSPATMQGLWIAGAAFTVSIAVAWTACSTTPPVTVVNLANGDKAEDVRGDAVKLK